MDDKFFNMQTNNIEAYCGNSIKEEEIKNLSEGYVMTKEIMNTQNGLNDHNINSIPIKRQQEQALTVNELVDEEYTIPGFFISLMVEKKRGISEEELYSLLLPKFEHMRKSDGSKYKVRKF